MAGYVKVSSEKKELKSPVSGGLTGAGRGPPAVTAKRGRKTVSGRALAKMPGGVSLPPAIKIFPPRRMRMYFSNSTNTGSYAVSVGSLLGAFGGICTVTNSTVSTVHSSVRVLKVQLWPGPSTTAAGAADLTWSGASGNIPDDERIRPVPEGVSVTGVLTFTPPKASLAALWWDEPDNGTTLFNIQGTPGSVVLVDVQLTQAQTVIPFPSTVATGTVGTFYYLALDGPSSNKWTPIGVTTTH